MFRASRAILRVVPLAVLSGLVLAGPAARLEHLSNGHAICPEHGEVLEVHGPQHGRRATSTDVSLTGLDDGVPGWSHDVCPFADTGAPGQAPGSPPLGVQRLPAVAPAASAEAVAPDRREVLLLLAPKSSPPSV